MGRIRRGWRLIGQGVQVLRADPELLLLPLAGLIGFFVTLAGLFAAVFRRMPEAADFRHGRYLLMFPLLVVAGIIPSLTNAALVAAACERLGGGDPTVRSGLRVVWRRLPQLLAWTLLNGLVSFLLQAVLERLKVGGRIAQAVVGLTWALATFFVIPVLLFEPVGPVDAVRRSSHLFRERWGEQVSALGSLGAAMMVIMLPVTVLGVILIAVSPVIGIAWLVAVLAILMVISGALNGVYMAALYRFAVAGEAAGPFTVNDLSQAFGPKKQRVRSHFRRQRQ